MVKQKVTKQTANPKSFKKAAAATTKNVTVAKPAAKKPRALLAKGMTDDGVTL